MAKSVIPYKLSAITDDGSDLICAMGQQSIMRQLATIEGATLRKTAEGKEYYAIPASRTNAMVAECLGVPSASQAYLSLRSKLMTVDDRLMAEWAMRQPELRASFIADAATLGAEVPTLAQKQFCALALQKRGMLNASEQGTGKTLTACMLMQAWSSQKTLIVCPSRPLVRQWAAEIKRTLAAPPPVIPLLSGNAKERAAVTANLDRGARLVLIVNYDVLAGILPGLQIWYPDTVILDESWMVKNPEARRTRAAILLCDKAEHVLGLNGTPFGQNVCDLWGQLRMVEPSRGRFFLNADEWRDSYAKTISMPVGRIEVQKVVGIKDPVSLMRSIEPMFFRATKASCIDLPEKLKPERLVLLMDGEAGRMYRAVDEAGDCVFYPLSLNGDRVTTIRKAQVVSGCCPIPHEWESILPTVHTPTGVRAILPSPKRDWCVEWVRDRFVHDRTYRAIFWLKYTTSIMVLTEELAKVLGGHDRIISVTGATKETDLARAKEEFNARDPDGVAIMVVQTAKMAYGHNLQACDWNIYYDHSWRCLERDQSEDRSHRLGRVGPVGYTELECTYISKKGRECYTVDADILRAYYARQDFADRFGPDTTGKVPGGMEVLD